MGVRVVKVGSIPFGLSVLVDERPGSLIVWLLESEWPQETAELLEQVLRSVRTAQGELATAIESGLHRV